MNGHPSLILLPGLGADARLFEPQRREFDQLLVPAWPKHDPADTLRTFARKMADVVRELRPSGSKLVLGGASMGGMIATEIAPIIRPDALVLIGSCLHPKEITQAARAAARASFLLSRSAIDRMRSLAPVAVRALGPMTRAQRDRLLEMTDAVSASFLLWGTRAIFEWQGAPAPPCRVFRVHGTLDRVIAPPTHPIDLLIPRAGHVPNLTQPEDVNRLLREAIEYADTRTSS